MDFRFLKRRQPSALILGFLLCALGIGSIPPSILYLYEGYQFDAPGTTQTALGRITNLQEFRGRGGPSYRLDYVYVVGRMMVHVRTFISSDNWHRLGPIGSPLEIEYLIAAPSVSEPVLPGEPGYVLRDGWLSSVLSFAIAALGYWAGLFSGKGKRTRTRKRK